MYKIVELLAGKVKCHKYEVRGNRIKILNESSLHVLMKAQIVKACVLQVGSDDLYYNGNYATSKLLLSRVSWLSLSDGKNSTFSDFKVNRVYRGLLSLFPSQITAIDRWEKALPNFPIRNSWSNMISYLNDPLLENKTREKLYKIYTRSMPVGRKFTQSSTISSKCAICNELEDELHCFVMCGRVKSLWDWLWHLLKYACPWIHKLTTTECLFGFRFDISRLGKYLQVWKVLHAETIRLIWYSRCRLTFDNEMIDVMALKGSIRYRTQKAFSIYEASSQKENAQLLI